MLPDGTNPLPEPILTNHQWAFVAFTGAISQEMLQISLIGVLKITDVRIRLHLPRPMSWFMTQWSWHSIFIGCWIHYKMIMSGSLSYFWFPWLIHFIILQRRSCYDSPHSSRSDSRFVSSQWETALLCNDVSHWLGTSLESALITHTLCGPATALNLSKNTPMIVIKHPLPHTSVWDMGCLLWVQSLVSVTLFTAVLLSISFYIKCKDYVYKKC